MNQAMERILVEKTQTVRSYLESRNLRPAMFVVSRDGRTLGLEDELHEGENAIMLPKIAGG